MKRISSIPSSTTVAENSSDASVFDLHARPTCQPSSSRLLLMLRFSILLGPVCLLTAGCGSRGQPTKAMHGSVTCGTEKVLGGQVVFMPIEGTPGANAAARIVDGQYRIDARGGVTLGKHRVCVDARKKTGRQVQGYNGRERATVDEEVRIGPPAYATEQSPLVVDIKADSDGVYDIVIPAQ